MALYLALSACVLGLLIVLSRRWHWIWKLSLVVIVLSAVTVSALLVSDDVFVRSGENDWWARTPWKETVLFACMLIGMSSKYLWDLIEIKKKKNAALKPGEPRSPLEFDFWDFVQPFLVAAIVFSGVLALIKEMNLTATLFSFQNGFFWQTVFFQKEAYRRVGPSGGETNTEVSL
jgi:hypothetical protein